MSDKLIDEVIAECAKHDREFKLAKLEQERKSEMIQVIMESTGVLEHTAEEIYRQAKAKTEEGDEWLLKSLRILWHVMAIIGVVTTFATFVSIAQTIMDGSQDYAPHNSINSSTNAS